MNAHKTVDMFVYKLQKNEGYAYTAGYLGSMLAGVVDMLSPEVRELFLEELKRRTDALR